MTDTETAIVMIAMAAALAFGVWFVRQCRKGEEPNMHDWRNENE